MQVPRVWLFGGGNGWRWSVAAGVVVIAALGAIAVRQPIGASPRVVPAPTPEHVLAAVAPPSPSEHAERRRADAGDRAAAVRLARRYVARGRALADPRYHGRAEAVLERWWTAPAPPDDVLLLRATIRQALHDFTAARADLDLLVARRPDDANARLTRAAVATVTGDLSTAAADCAAIATAGELAAGELIVAACLAPLASASGELDAAYARLDRALVAAAATAPPDVAAWAWTSLGELARQRGDDPAAERALQIALALDPAGTYTLAQLADLYLDGGRADAAADLLRGAGEADALLLRLAIAERRLADPAAPIHRRLIRDRLEAGLARGDHTHQREYGRYLLELADDPHGALAAARRNWDLQKEPIDARLVLDAARAAGDRAAAATVIAWLDDHAVADAVLTRAGARGEGAR